MTGSPGGGGSAAYRDAGLVKELARSIRELDPGGPVRLMHVCGTHENALCQFGLRDLFPPWLTLIAGPGCPVCVCPAGEIDMAVRAATEKGALVASFGDVMRVPARVSLADAQAAGADCRVVYSIDDAVDLARSGPKRTVVFFAVGFETTACTTAAALKRGVPENFLVLSSHRVVPPALEALLSLGRSRVDGFLLPGHVTTVAGLGDYEALGQRCRVPMAVAGFEPVDILLAVKDMVARQGSRGERFEGVTNAYRRSVRAAGNPTAVAVTREVFTPSDAAWRGLGVIPRSGLALRPAYAAHDARVVLGLAPDPEVRDLHPGCRCGEVLLGDVEPEDCPLFGARCTPDDPLGACMVAFEGTCHARHRAGHRRKVGA